VDEGVLVVEQSSATHRFGLDFTQDGRSDPSQHTQHTQLGPAWDTRGAPCGAHLGLPNGAHQVLAAGPARDAHGISTRDDRGATQYNPIFP
jgi:hypothetical protein